MEEAAGRRMLREQAAQAAPYRWAASSDRGIRQKHSAASIKARNQEGIFSASVRQYRHSASADMRFLPPLTPQ
jgi:hypothetical protein